MVSLFLNRHRFGGDFFIPRINRRRFLWYSPPMLSMIVLAIITMPLLFHTAHYREPERWLFISVSDRIAPQREYLDIELTGENKRDQIKLDFSRIMIEDLTINRDSLRGIHFIFRPTAKYKSLVRVISDLQEVGADSYIYNVSGLWMYYERQHHSEEDIDDRIRL